MGLLRDSSKTGQVPSNVRQRESRPWPLWGDIEDIVDGEWLDGEEGVVAPPVKGLDTGFDALEGASEGPEDTAGDPVKSLLRRNPTLQPWRGHVASRQRDRPSWRGRIRSRPERLRGSSMAGLRVPRCYSIVLSCNTLLSIETDR